MIPESRPFASFCISTFQRATFLKTTLDSIRLQTFKDFEVIVSDNDTIQSARAVVESFNDSRFKYFANEADLGMKKSFNRSLERSSGQYIVMIADDDPVYPQMLEILNVLQEKYPGKGLYMGGCDWFCTSPKVGDLYGFKVGTNSCLSNDHEVDDELVYEPQQFLEHLFTFKIFPHYLWSSAIVKREVLQSIGGVPEYGTPFLGDYAYMASVGAQSGCVIINRSLGCQTLHMENFGRHQHEQIATAVKNFPKYLDSRVSHIQEWPTIRPLMIRFTALWAVSHMTFLFHLAKRTGDKANLSQAEKEVFRIDYMRKYKLKYFLKKKWPLFHNLLVTVKKKFRK
jgi:glycosyltransferase involved in cell wall biosynthesis